MKSSLPASFLSALALVAAHSAGATLSTFGLFELGEPGSFVSDLPQDTIGGFSFLGNSGSAPALLTLDPSPASPAYAHFNGEYAYAADLSTFPSDNFGIVLWARVTDPNQDVGLFTSAKKDDGRLTFHLLNGNWAASYKGLGWIGAAEGVGQTATADAWTQLAIIREDGISSFYINGVAQPGTLPDAPVFTNNAHLAVISGGTGTFLGDLDELRLFTFDPLTDNPLSALAVVPEPASLVSLCGLFGLGLGVGHRRRV